MNAPGENTINPAGSPSIRPAVDKPVPPGDDVTHKQDPTHTEQDFLRDLDRAASRKKS